MKIEGIKIVIPDLRNPNERVNGLIGLDYLRAADVVLDLVDLVMYRKG